VAKPPFEVTREQKLKIGKTDKERREDSRTDAVVFLLSAIAIAIKTILTNESS
jgi:hypothetical protein